MAHALRRTGAHSSHGVEAAAAWLDDEHVHTDQALAGVTFVLGLVALISAAWDVHVFTAWIGVIATALGGWAQMVSQNRYERFLTVIGATSGALGLWFALNNGGFS